MSLFKMILASLVVTSLSIGNAFATPTSAHAEQRKKERGISQAEIERTLAKTPGVAQTDKPTLKQKGSKTTVITDSKSGKVVTAWKTKK